MIHDEYERDSGIFYIGPRAFLIALAAFCFGFLGFLYSVERITESFGTRLVGGIDSGGLLAPSSLPARVTSSAPSTSPSLGPATARDARRGLPMCAPTPPCIAGAKVRPHPATAARPIPPAAAGRPHPANRPVPAVPARSAAPPVVRSLVRPVAPPIAAPSVVAPVRPVRRSAVRPTAPRTPAALLVPSGSGGALTPTDGLEPRSGGGPLLLTPSQAAPQAPRLR